MQEDNVGMDEMYSTIGEPKTNIRNMRDLGDIDFIGGYY
jgi:hypothetical protein